MCKLKWFGFVDILLIVRELIWFSKYWHGAVVCYTLSPKMNYILSFSVEKEKEDFKEKGFLIDRCMKKA